MKLNYSFSKREIIMILALLLVLVGLLYYRFVYLGISGQVEQYNTADLEAQIQIEQLQLIEWQKMQDEIKGGSIATSSLETYDNQKDEITFLNNVFVPVIRYNFSFDRPVATGDTVRRNVAVTFTAINYETALKIIQQIHNSPYRILLKDIRINYGDLIENYLKNLADAALRDDKSGPVAMTQLKKQVAILLESGSQIDPYVMKVHNGEPITEAEEETVQAGQAADAAAAAQDGAQAADVPQETLADGTIALDGQGTADASDAASLAGGTVETLADGTVVAPQGIPAGAGIESESESESEEPVQTLENSIVNVSMTMTFYETAYGAESLDGLIIETPATAAAEE